MYNFVIYNMKKKIDGEKMEIKLKENERIDDLEFKNLKIIQDKAHYNNILILGYGDLAKQLANILKSNYDITICNRNNKDLDEIKQIYHHLDLNALSGKYDLIINTIPVCKINYKKLKYKQIYDLAQTVEGKDYQSLRNIPNLYFPYESALLMFQYIHGVMRHV